MPDVMPDVLAEICETKRREVAEARRARPELDPALAPEPRSLDLGRFGVIAEVKRASPSAGRISTDADPAGQATVYESAGACAVSVLTDSEYFGGSIDDLRAVRASVSVPVLRKDFVVDPWQITESRVAGADVVLVIVAALSGKRVLDFADTTRALGMTPLVEVHGVDEIPVAVEAVADGGILGVNARDLKTLEVDLAVWESAAERIPEGVVSVAESGIRVPGDAARAADAGYDGVLCGEALMRSPDPAAFVSEMLAVVGR